MLIRVGLGTKGKAKDLPGVEIENNINEHDLAASTEISTLGTGSRPGTPIFVSLLSCIFYLCLFYFCHDKAN